MQNFKITRLIIIINSRLIKIFLALLQEKIINIFRSISLIHSS